MTHIMRNLSKNALFLFKNENHELAHRQKLSNLLLLPPHQAHDLPSLSAFQTQDSPERTEIVSK